MQNTGETDPELEFSLWNTPDQDVDHIVIGRTGWDASLLEEQIAAREEKWFNISGRI